MRIIPDFPDFQQYDGGVSFTYQKKQFTQKKELGAGGFGQVFLFEATDKTQVAVKCELPYQEKFSSGRDFQMETDWYCKIYGLGEFSGNAKKTKKPHYVLMPYIKGQLFNEIQYAVEEQVLRDWLHIGKALQKLHETFSIVHCDIKASNIILNYQSNQDKAFIIDFGALTIIGENRLEIFNETNQKTYWHQPPELFLKTDTQTLKAHPTQDIYGLGMLLQYMQKKFLKHNTHDTTVVCTETTSVVETVISGLTMESPQDRWSIAKGMYVLTIAFFSQIPRTLWINSADKNTLDSLHYDEIMPVIWRAATILTFQMHIHALRDEQKTEKSTRKEQKIEGLRSLQYAIKTNNPETGAKLISDATIKFPSLTAGLFSTRIRDTLEYITKITPMFY